MELRCGVIDSTDQHLLLAAILLASGETEETESSLAYRSLGQIICDTVEARAWHLPPRSKGRTLG